MCTTFNIVCIYLVLFWSDDTNIKISRTFQYHVVSIGFALINRSSAVLVAYFFFSTELERRPKSFIIMSEFSIAAYRDVIHCAASTMTQTIFVSLWFILELATNSFQMKPNNISKHPFRDSAPRINMCNQSRSNRQLHPRKIKIKI